MKNFKAIDKVSASKIRYIFCDIDDTITTEGKLSLEAYAALWSLYHAGYLIIPITGRPAGWCDLMIRHWPIYAIIGENGAFAYYFKAEQLQKFTHPSVIKPDDLTERFDKIRNAAMVGVPGCRIAKDQFSRLYDLAIDFNEDPPYLGFEAAEKIKDICISFGAEAKVSSIHVNTWFGKYDKLSMAQLFMKDVLREEDIKEKILFFGDSPNDEPMFEFFPNSCAVANIKPFIKRLNHLPTYITEQESGKGFAEAIDHLLSLRSKGDV